MKNKIPVMAHLVLGYPTMATSLTTAESYVRAGVAVLELQIPFSHPTADGPVITAACQEAVAGQGVTVAGCLAAIRTIRTRHPDQEIVVMSYLNRVFAYGLQEFAEALNALKIKHLIVPDLPVDSPLALELPGLKLVPVLAANVTDERLNTLLRRDFDFFYLMADFKITGAAFSLHPRLQHIIGRLKSAGPARRVGIGFGISTPEQARLATREADLAIIGSALIVAQQAGQLDVFLGALRDAFAEKIFAPA